MRKNPLQILAVAVLSLAFQAPVCGQAQHSCANIGLACATQKCGSPPNTGTLQYAQYTGCMRGCNLLTNACIDFVTVEKSFLDKTHCDALWDLYNLGEKCSLQTAPSFFRCDLLQYTNKCLLACDDANKKWQELCASGNYTPIVSQSLKHK